MYTNCEFHSALRVQIMSYLAWSTHNNTGDKGGQQWEHFVGWYRQRTSVKSDKNNIQW